MKPHDRIFSPVDKTRKCDEDA